MSAQERLQMPQKETGLINFAYAQTGISPHINHTNYGTFCTRTCLEIQDSDTPISNQSFSKVTKNKQFWAEKLQERELQPIRQLIV